MNQSKRRRIARAAAHIAGVQPVANVDGNRAARRHPAKPEAAENA